MESTAFNHAAWNPLPSIGMLLAMLHIIHCIQSGCIGPHCVNRTEYNRDPLCQNACSLLHSMTLHGIHCILSGCFWPCCIKYTAFNHAARNPLHPIAMVLAMLHKIHCIQSGCIGPRCMVSTAYKRDPLHHNVWNVLH